MKSDEHRAPYPYLVPYPAENVSKPICLEPGEIFIGRAPSNAIQLTHGGVSRVHAKISTENGCYVLTDLKSRNGTFVNNIRIDQTNLNPNDKIYFGKRGFVFLTDPAELEEVATDIALALGDTITIGEEKNELSELIAHRADRAAHNFFEPPSEENAQPHPSLMAHKRLSLLYRLSEKLRVSKDIDEILDKGLELLFEALPYVQRAVAILKSDATGSLEVRALKFRNPKSDEDTIPVSRTVLDRVALEQVAIISPDVSDDARFNDTDSMVIHDITSIICVPLIRDNKVIGALYVDTNDRLNPFTQNDMEFTAAVSNELALSIENCCLQQEAVKNEKIMALGLTVVNLAHNIKNLLTMNTNSVDLMNTLLKTIKDEDIQKNWHFVRQSLDRIADLTADMMEYTQIEHPELKRLDINKAILNDCELFKESLASEGIVLELNFESKLPAWEMNERFLQRAILNLVVNAKDALVNNKYGRIKISTASGDDQRLIISVADNGCGIEADKLDKIFQLFYTTKGMDGSGLGLPMVQKFVESLGGRVLVDSRPGAGATFNMVFPRVHEKKRSRAEA